MTREEAKAYFKRHIDLYCVTGICREAEEMAIQALEQEPSGDLISRQAALELIADFDLSMGQVVRGIHALPSVKLSTGHWIIMGDRYIKCSECGHITKTESPDIYHFCMVCGANMSEEPTGSESEVEG